MRLVNPYYVNPQRAEIDAAKPEIASYLQANNDRAYVSFDELRQAVPALADIADGVIAEAAREAGLDAAE